MARRIVTITIEGEVPDTLHLGHVVANILERHAADIRDRENVAGQRNTVLVTQTEVAFLALWAKSVRRWWWWFLRWFRQPALKFVYS